MKNLILAITLLFGSWTCFSQAITTTGSFTPCESERVVLNASPSTTMTAASTADKPITWKWKGPNGFESTDREVTFKEISQSQSGVYEVEMSLKGGVIEKAAQILSIKLKPIVKHLSHAATQTSIVILGEAGAASDIYEWTHPDGTTSTALNFSKTVVAGSTLGIGNYGEYILKITGSNGCITTIKRTILLDEKSDEKTAATPVFGTIEDDEDDRSFTYIFIKEAGLKVCTVNGEILEDETYTSPTDAIFRMIGQTDEGYVIRYWKWKEGSELYKDYNGDDGKRFFLIEKDDFESKAIKWRPTIFNASGWKKNFAAFGITAATMIIPIKLRKKPYFDFSKDVTLGPFFGIRMRLSHYKPNFFNLGGTVGITSVSLDPNNANPKIITKGQDIAAFTWALGGVFEFDRVQIGFMWGRDRISGNDNRQHTTTQSTIEGVQWDFHNKTWFSVGLGYSLLSRPANTKKVSEGSNN